MSPKLPKKKPPTRRGKEDLEPPFRSRRLGQEMTALLLLGLALFFLLALGSHNLRDPEGVAAVWRAAGVHNWGGKAGALLSYYLMGGLGLAAFWLPIMILGLAWRSYRRGLDDLSSWQALAGAGVFLASAGLLELGWHTSKWGGIPLRSGGMVGNLLGGGLLSAFNRPGAALALGLILLVSFMGAFRLSYVGLMSLMGQAVGGLGALIFKRREREEKAPVEPAKPRRAAASQPVITIRGAEVDEAPLDAVRPSFTGAAPEAAGRRRPPVPGQFILPSLDLLDPIPKLDQEVQEGVMLALASKLEDTLRHFGVDGKVTAIRPGPVVSRFELEPAPGVKISKVTNLADDLALALRALSIRIVAPVPGKAVIGIEVPNPKRQLVTLREILSDSGYQKSASRLTIGLGKDIMGAPVITDLAKMPHLLIAGATGTGKSVGLNTMILSVLFKSSPEEVRLLLIDPKRIELSTYEGIPHLLHPVVVNPKEATTALRWAVEEMERRYELLSDMSVRNIEGYNQKVGGPKKARPTEEEPAPRRMPFIVIVIDELADLMMVSSRETEEYLIRLAQKARASGVHLLVATQRPSVDVITGLIKANFPTRISYQVSSRVDSRTILDSMGAERLLGDGDLLFLPPGTSRLKRVHGAFVSEPEVARLVDYLKAQQAPEFEPGIRDMAAREVEAEELGEKDDKYVEALELVAETRNASISMLQRRLRVGYNRAARIIEMMEKEGLVGPSDGLKPRDVYIPRR